MRQLHRARKGDSMNQDVDTGSTRDDAPITQDAAPEGRPARMSPQRLRLLGGVAGIAGPVLLVVYFVVPAVTDWPYAGASPAQLVHYATIHALLFYAGGWLQATGALLSIVFFLTLLNLSATARRLSGLATIVGCALLLSVVVVEAALLEAVPMAAAAGDSGTVATTFALSNGVFARIFPLAPAPLLFAGIGFALEPAVLRPAFARSALIVAALFVVAGIAAIFGTPGLIFAIVMSVVQALWILTAGVALTLSARRVHSAGVTS